MTTETTDKEKLDRLLGNDTGTELAPPPPEKKVINRRRQRLSYTTAKSLKSKTATTWARATKLREELLAIVNEFEGSETQVALDLRSALVSIDEANTAIADASGAIDAVNSHFEDLLA